jgi:hypothetical protein
MGRIADAIGAPTSLVEQILERIESQNLLKLARWMGGSEGGAKVIDMHPELRRRWESQ